VTVVLESARVRAEVDPRRGARLVSLRFDGHEVLGRADDLAVAGESVGTGSFPMVPWAGRVRGHDLHGTGRDAIWRHDGDGRFSADLGGGDWPDTGTATLDYRLDDDAITATLTWGSAGTHGCSLGFHPWFRRTVDGVEVAAEVRPVKMVERGADHLPTGRLVSPSAPPWDDCFVLSGPPRLVWPGLVDLTLESDAGWWVVYTEPHGALCIEPQTAPPDVWSHRHLQPDLPTRLAFTIRLS